MCDAVRHRVGTPDDPENMLLLSLHMVEHMASGLSTEHEGLETHSLSRGHRESVTAPVAPNSNRTSCCFLFLPSLTSSHYNNVVRCKW